MERAHGELRARLADRLSGDDTHRLAHVHGRAAGEIAPVAHAANARLGIAGEDRTDAHLLHAGGDDLVDLRLAEQRAVRHHDLVAGRIAHIFSRGAAEDAGRQRRHHGAGVDDRPYLDAPGGAAIHFGDDAVLRHVDETPGQITGVRRLQRGVGQTLTGAVRRVEVLEHREPFLEVGNDRGLDDLTGRLGHEAAHAGELAHLRGRAARAGVRHHVDRVDLGFLALLGRRPGRRDFLHHRFGDLLGALRPGVDHLVVLFAVGDQAVIVLLLEVFDLLARILDDLPLGVRHDHVVLAEGDAGLERMMEAERHHAVAEDDGLFLPAMAIDGIDHVGDFALRHQLVDEVERNLRLLRQHFAQNGAAGRGLVPLAVRRAFVVDALIAVLDLAVQRDGLLVQRMLDFAQVAIEALHDVALFRIGLDVLLRMQLKLPLPGRVSASSER